MTIFARAVGPGKVIPGNGAAFNSAAAREAPPIAHDPSRLELFVTLREICDDCSYLSPSADARKPGHSSIVRVCSVSRLVVRCLAIIYVQPFRLRQ